MSLSLIVFSRLFSKEGLRGRKELKKSERKAKDWGEVSTCPLSVRFHFLSYFFYSLSSEEGKTNETMPSVPFLNTEGTLVKARWLVFAQKHTLRYPFSASVLVRVYMRATSEKHPPPLPPPLGSVSRRGCGQKQNLSEGLTNLISFAVYSYLSILGSFTFPA